MTTAAASVARPSASSGTSRTPVADTWDVTWRNLFIMMRTPQGLVFALIQPVLFVLLFRYAFGGAIRVTGVPYVDYLVPGIFAQSVAFGAIGTGVGLSSDLRGGLLGRFRALPMWRGAILTGRTIADLIRNLAVLAIMVGVGFAVGFRVHTSVPAFLAALGLVAFFGYALSWGFVALALLVGTPEATQAAGVPIMFLLVFASPAFIQLGTMPGWLQVVAGHQPLAALVNAVRSLVLGGPTAHYVLTTVAWSSSLLLVFAVSAVLRYQRLNR
jgi:ABC-2 type transport system permease protein/oleandomycin transport system permease protein